MIWIAILVGAVIIVAVILIVIGMRDVSDADPLLDRLAEYAARGEITDLEEIELSQPLTERIVFPIARKLGELALRFTPQNAIQQTAHKLEMAGNPGGMDPTVFWALWYLAFQQQLWASSCQSFGFEGELAKGKRKSVKRCQMH
jgi:tight adherence protein C